MASGARTEQGRAAAYSTLLYEQGATVLGAVTNRAVMMVSPYFVGRPRFSFDGFENKSSPGVHGHGREPAQSAHCVDACARKSFRERPDGMHPLVP
jgi:hypothetical protein